MTQAFSAHSEAEDAIVVFPFSAVGDFVRCHTLVRLVAERHPGRPIDVVVRKGAIEIAQFMPEIRSAIAEDFRHRRIDLRGRLALARTLRERRYRTAYVVPTSFKAAVVPYLAGIPERIGWSDELRYPLVNRMRFGLKRMERILDEIALLGLARGEDAPELWPVPQLEIPAALKPQVAELRIAHGADAPVIALAPGSADPRRIWPAEHFAELAARCAARGWTVWVVGASWEKGLAQRICTAGHAHDLTQTTLTSLVLTLAAADAFVGNDSGPLHIAAAFGKPAVGVFGRANAFVGAPINAGVRVVEAPRAASRRDRHQVRWPTADAVMRELEAGLRAGPPGGAAEDGGG